MAERSIGASLPPRDVTRTTRREHEFALVDLVIGYAALDAGLDALAPQERAGDLDAWNVDYRSSPSVRHPDLAAVAPSLTDGGDPANYRLAVDLHIEAVRARAAVRRTTAHP